MDIKEIFKRSKAFTTELDATKARIAPKEFNWYPYGTLGNFFVLEKLLTGTNRSLLELCGEAPMVDIGAGDGDTAFFMESLGCDVDAVDYPPTNFNSCRGIKALKESLHSNVTIHEVDLDRDFSLPGKFYGLAFFLGILYHLKNPFGALENLAHLAKYALISTRITRYNLAPKAHGSATVNKDRVELKSVPAAYLVDSHETNNDPTNFWIFSEAGLQRILQRSGWEPLDFITIGNQNNSDPATNEGDERAFCLVRSRHFE